MGYRRKIKNIKSKMKLSVNKLNVAKLTSGTMLGQLITIFTLPIITRLYGAEIIGVWALVNSIAFIINSFSDLGLKDSLMIESDEDVEKNFKVITTLAFITSIVVSGIISLVFFYFSISSYFSPLLLFIFLTITVFTLQQVRICYTFLNKKGEYNILMKNPLINNGFNGILGIGFGLLGFITYGYFIAQIVGQIITIVHMRRNLPKSMFTFNLNDIKYIIKKHKRFVAYQMPTGVVEKIQNQLPVILIQSLWNSEILGYYTITIRLLGIPSSLVGSAIGRVFFKIASDMRREEKPIGPLAFRNLTLAMKLAVIPMSIIIASGDIVAVLFLGEEWLIAGEFIKILGLFYFFVFVTDSVRGLYIVLNKQNYALVSVNIQLIVTAVTLIMGKLVFDNIYIALLSMSFINIIVNLGYFSFLLSVMRESWFKFLRNSIGYLLLMLLLSGVLRYFILKIDVLESILM